MSLAAAVCLVLFTTAAAPDQPVIAHPPITRRSNEADPVDGTSSRPTSTSGAQAGHMAPTANDGQEQTSWRAPVKDAAAFWAIDLENLCVIRCVALATVGRCPASSKFHPSLSSDRPSCVK